MLNAHHIHFVTQCELNTTFGRSTLLSTLEQVLGNWGELGDTGEREGGLTGHSTTCSAGAFSVTSDFHWSSSSGGMMMSVAARRIRESCSQPSGAGLLSTRARSSMVLPMPISSAKMPPRWRTRTRSAAVVSTVAFLRCSTACAT